MKIAFVTLASRDYFPGAKKLFESIKFHTDSKQFKCILLSDETDVEEIFEGLFDEIKSLPNLPEDLAFSVSVPRFKFTLHKLYVLQMLQESDFDRIIFFDSDLLCLASLDFLLSADLNKHHFLAVRDFACVKYYPKEIAELHLKPNQIFNSGCFVITRGILDCLNYSSLISIFSSSFKSYDGGDQGYFNFVIQNSNVKFSMLPLQFNYPLDTNYPFVWRPPALVHFSGEKPWSPNSKIPYWDKSIFRFWNLDRSKHRQLSSHHYTTVTIW